MPCGGDHIRDHPSGGYADNAEALANLYESVSFEQVHHSILHLIPARPGLVLDVGAGTGRDAAALAMRGHRVLAVEPTARFRSKAAALHAAPRIEWLDDHLPDLPQVSARGARFDLIMMTAVWMHLDRDERSRAMTTVAALLERGAIMTLTLRHGPVPPGRRMFDVSGDETVRLAVAAGLTPRLRIDREADHFGRADVSWTRLAFSRERA